MRRLLTIVALLGLAVLPALTAPAPKKDAETPLPPATPEQKATAVINLKQFGLALHNYHDTHGFLPANTKTKDGKPGLSWRVQILPFIEEDQLYKQFKLDEAWDSEHNKKLIEQMPKMYTPVRGRAEPGQTFYQMFAGKRTLLGADGQGVTFAQVVDGLSLTLMVVEGDKPVIWTRPDDIPYDGQKAPKVGGMFDSHFHAVMGDGAVRRFEKKITAEALRRLIDRADGQEVDINGLGADPDTDKD
jgi:hypothetical protein